jgi:hypothetical protein
MLPEVRLLRTSDGARNETGIDVGITLRRGKVSVRKSILFPRDHPAQISARSSSNWGNTDETGLSLY